MVTRREFVRICGKVIIATVSGSIALDGASKLVTVDETFAKNYPAYKFAYEHLIAGSSMIKSAIGNLEYNPPFFGEISGAVEMPVYVNIPEKYPRPLEAKENIKGALHEYELLSQVTGEKTDIGIILQDVYASLPNNETIENDKNIFEAEIQKLSNAYSQSRALENKYDVLLSSESDRKTGEALKIAAGVMGLGAALAI